MALPAQDSFTNSDGVQLTTHSANWTLNSGDFHIQSNAIAPDAASTELLAHWNNDSFDADQYSLITIIANDSPSVSIGVSVRCDTGGDDYGYGIYQSSTYIRLFELTNGSWAELDNAPAVAAGSEIKLEVIGTTGANLKGYDDDVEILSGSDSSLTSGAAGLSGWNVSAGGTRADDWEGGDLGGDYEVSKADSLTVGEAASVGPLLLEVDVDV